MHTKLLYCATFFSNHHAINRIRIGIAIFPGIGLTRAYGVNVELGRGHLQIELQNGITTFLVVE